MNLKCDEFVFFILTSISEFKIRNSGNSNTTQNTKVPARLHHKRNLKWEMHSKGENYRSYPLTQMSNIHFAMIDEVYKCTLLWGSFSHIFLVDLLTHLACAVLQRCFFFLFLFFNQVWKLRRLEPLVRL